MVINFIGKETRTNHFSFLRYSEICLNQNAPGPTFVFGIDRTGVWLYTGKINKYFLHWDFIKDKFIQD